jgi:hypothetical protein
LNKNLTGEITGRWRNGFLEGFMRAEPIGFMGLGLSQQILKGQGTLRFSVRDVFHTQIFKGRTQYSNVDFKIHQVQDTQVGSIAFSYKFNKGKKIASVKRTAGSANEEQERISQ